MGDLRASGATPAAKAAAASQLIGSQGQGMMGLLANAGQQYQSAIANAANMTNAQQDIMQKDITNRYGMYVDPYKAQLNQGISSLAAAQGSEAVQSARQNAVANPMAGLASGLGQSGEMGLGKFAMSLLG
jgi:hypothetical protein